MKITVIGTGYVGLVSAACFANLGNEVIGVDIDEKKVELLNKGEPHFFEPGLKEILKRNVTQKRIYFTTNLSEGIKESEIIFLCLPTPEGKDSRADLSAVLSVAEEIGKLMDSYKVIVNKSTVPVGTGDLVKERIKSSQTSEIPFDLVSNPEFLKEGASVNDFMNPDRIVVGAETEKAKEIMNNLYEGIVRADQPIIFTDIRSAEIIKYASNSMLATRISFVNMLAHLCEKSGADIKAVSKGMGLDKRIGTRFLHAGVGYGGSCFPKDVAALIKTMEDYDVNTSILTSVQEVNRNQRESILSKVENFIGDVNGKTITLWGVSFKPKTDDIRDSPALDIGIKLIAKGAKVKAFDPVAQEIAKKKHPEIEFYQTPYESAIKSNCIILFTEWDVFRNLDLDKIKDNMADPNFIDGRNVYSRKQMKKIGFNYQGIGR